MQPRIKKLLIDWKSELFVVQVLGLGFVVVVVAAMHSFLLGWHFLLSFPEAFLSLFFPVEIKKNDTVGGNGKNIIFSKWLAKFVVYSVSWRPDINVTMQSYGSLCLLEKIKQSALQI